MEPANLKLLLHSYIQYKNQNPDPDECDGLVGNLAECDNPINHRQYVGGSWNIMTEQASSLPMFENGFVNQSMPSIPSNNAQAPVVEVARRLNEFARQFSNSQPEKSIIKFKEICMITDPVEQIISIPVMRDPQYSDRVTKVSWNTCDKTALSGTHYIESSGDMVFNENEMSKDIKIKILNSNDDEDLRFTVQLEHDGLFDAQPMTVSLKKISNFYSDERDVLNNLPSSLPISISHITSALCDKLNDRTFHMALTHLCSTNDKIDVQLGLALELSSWCLVKMHNKIRQDTVLHVLSSFFRKDNYSF